MRLPNRWIYAGDGFRAPSIYRTADASYRRTTDDANDESIVYPLAARRCFCAEYLFPKLRRRSLAASGKRPAVITTPECASMNTPRDLNFLPPDESLSITIGAQSRRPCCASMFFRFVFRQRARDMVRGHRCISLGGQAVIYMIDKFHRKWHISLI